jgi:TonB family protein
MPRLTPMMKMQARDRGVIEVVIDELGRVAFAAIRSSVQPLYDAELLSASRDWRYQPATMAGKPVKYRKMIQINVSRTP